MVLMGLWTKKPAEGQGDQSKSEADALVERLGATLEEKFGKKFEAVDTLLSKWNKMEEEANRSLTEEQQRAARENEESLTPEQKLSNENKKLLALQILTNARITESECLDEVKTQWPHLVPRIKEILASIPFDDKAKADYPQRCRNAVKLVVGDEAIKSGLRYNKDNSKFMIEDGVERNEGDDSPLLTGDYDWQDPKNPKHTLTGMQQLQKLGIDPKKFEAFMQKNGVD
jgi:hypothetical protein